MKKKTLLFVAVSSILLASCGGSGWSCKKRYCDTIKKNVKIVMNSEITCR